MTDCRTPTEITTETPTQTTNKKSNRKDCRSESSFNFAMEKMRVYLDNCCYNRPFDEQVQLSVRLETEAKMEVQSQMRFGILEYVLTNRSPHDYTKWRENNMYIGESVYGDCCSLPAQRLAIRRRCMLNCRTQVTALSVCRRAPVSNISY